MSAHLRVEIDDRHCQPCRRLLAGILTDPPASDDWDWESQMLGEETVRCFKNHHPSYRALVASAKESSCIVCATTVAAIHLKNFMTLAEHLRHSSGEDLTYQFWFQKRDWRETNCLLAFGFGAMSQYRTNIQLPGGGTRRGLEMELHRRNGADSDWSAVDIDKLFETHTWPVLARRPNPDSGSGEAVQRSARWLTECLQNHTACSRPPSKLPKRVLDVSVRSGGEEPDDFIRLYETRGEGEPFVALSYCWGPAVTLTTVSSNIETHRRVGIPVANFPLTLREAISFTRKLGFRYLWIDALCIIQDDADDWAEQAACMMDVYGTSTVTLSATSSYDCDHGLFARMSKHESIPVGRYLYPLNDAGTGHDHGHGTIFLDPQGLPAPFDLDKEYLSTRGWTFQERLVSPRTLHFTDGGIVWECSEASLEEGAGTHWGKRGLKMGFTELVRPDLQDTGTGTDFKDRVDERAALQRRWNRWIGDFSARKLTRVSDKLPAVAGIARTFAARFGGDRYIAGLWASRFVTGLVWMRHYKGLSLVRHADAGVPSWSWASVTGQLSLWDLQPEPAKAGVDMVIREISVVEKRKGSYGEVEPGGYIRAEGMLQLVELDRSAELRNPNGPYYPCSITDGLVLGVDIECWMDQMEYGDPEEPFACWCLRLCSYTYGGQDRSLAFLFLEKLPDGENRFRRIGAGVTEVLVDEDGVEADWDEVFVSGNWTTFQLV